MAVTKYGSQGLSERRIPAKSETPERGSKNVDTVQRADADNQFVMSGPCTALLTHVNIISPYVTL